jgi:hypothetical protein
MSDGRAAPADALRAGLAPREAAGEAPQADAHGAVRPTAEPNRQTPPR